MSRWRIFLDPDHAEKMIEGHPAPLGAIFTATNSSGSIGINFSWHAWLPKRLVLELGA